ncbi:hypothetical protein [Lacinutrix sp.]|uniref:hypothetical protein n=1 Tax=Lacinutrix sp. TaxID=1937692 RepID=UPI0025BCC217|nr:hypothetical protein [Lacinutrix sp.]
MAPSVGIGLKVKVPPAVPITFIVVSSQFSKTINVGSSGSAIVTSKLLLIASPQESVIFTV